MTDDKVSYGVAEKRSVCSFFSPSLLYMVELDNFPICGGVVHLKRLHASFSLNRSYFALYLPLSFSG